MELLCRAKIKELRTAKAELVERLQRVEAKGNRRHAVLVDRFEAEVAQLAVAVALARANAGAREAER